ncbi:acyl-CoA/acyl-ACP dehydrogenase [Crossiella sp. CA-258035]|uniref:acyl-CoA dehydrogenase family protein n=1 Tax=Crossiella sp. CA-258035 TaxID=2981138 RepID=UPI0024BC595B|nr:acyl-CoA dehydrogenase family protein [Crossiella sp. CA-258035]WHT21985.1 acyl-CoA/acyl-ACP dehydrogenase [Crossiella sp. CA-258035]
MDFSMTEAQQALSTVAGEVLAREVTQERLRAAESGPDRFDRPLWNNLGASGLLGAGIPEQLGGSGYGVLEQCSVLVALGRAVAPVPYLASTVLAASAIAEFGDPAVRERWLPGALSGESVLTAALTDESATTAERTAEGWLLNGTKTAVPAGGIAALFLVSADTPDGPRAFLVTPEDPRVSVRRQEVVDGAGTAWLELNGTPLPADRVLDGAAVEFLHTRGVLGWCALQLGVTERALELTAAYARERVQFGRPIGQFQAVAQRLADAYIDVEGIRLTLWQAAWRVSEGLPSSESLATAKFWAADAGHRVAHTAVHIHGGVGIDLDHQLHRYFTAAKHAEFALGSATPHLRTLGTELLRHP